MLMMVVVVDQKQGVAGHGAVPHVPGAIALVTAGVAQRRGTDLASGTAGEQLLLWLRLLLGLRLVVLGLHEHE